MYFDDYLRRCLYEPGLGYYSAGLQKFGHGGDFVTAPELGSLFAETLARAIAPILRNSLFPTVLELGAGTGALLTALWPALERLQALPDQYFILETSADLRERQIETLSRRCPNALPRVVWLDHVPSERFNGVVLANEVLDAIPCARFIARAGELHEQGVSCVDGGQLNLCELEARPLVKAIVDKVRAQAGSQWPSLYISECMPSLSALVAAVTQPLREGVALWIDYGYPRLEFYHPERSDGTLVGHYRHRTFHDPLWYPGLVDLSSWVDFTALAEAADQCQLSVAGFSTQAQFLLAAGITEALEGPSYLPERERTRRHEEARILTLPGEMGDRFKVMCLSRGIELEALPEALRLTQLLDRL